MPALFSRDWQFHHIATLYQDDSVDRHEGGKRTKEILFQCVAAKFVTFTHLDKFVYVAVRW